MWQEMDDILTPDSVHTHQTRTHTPDSVHTHQTQYTHTRLSTHTHKTKNKNFLKYAQHIMYR